MKTFNLSEISTTKRTEILNEARHNGAILQKKNTNGEVLEEFLLISDGPLRHSGHSIQMVRDMTEA